QKEQISVRVQAWKSYVDADRHFIWARGIEVKTLLTVNAEGKSEVEADHQFDIACDIQAQSWQAEIEVDWHRAADQVRMQNEVKLDLIGSAGVGHVAIIRRAIGHAIPALIVKILVENEDLEAGRPQAVEDRLLEQANRAGAISLQCWDQIVPNVLNELRPIFQTMANQWKGDAEDFSVERVLKHFQQFV